MDSAAWAAGLFESAGTITRCNGRMRLAVKMQSEASVRRFAEIVGAGKVYGPYGPYESMIGSAPYFMWAADGGLAARAAFETLQPHLSSWVLSRWAEVVGMDTRPANHVETVARAG